MSTLPSIALLLFLITFFRLSSTSKDIVVVKYAREELRRTEGQSLTLKCTAEYKKKVCEDIKVVWQPLRLSHPDKYTISINETKMINQPGFRERNVFLSLEKLTIADTGNYQCIAECNVTTATGHIISVSVTGNVIKDQKTLNRSHQYSQDTVLLSIFILFLHALINT